MISKKGKLSEEEYKEKFLASLRKRSKEVIAWINSCDPRKDITLLCYEKPGEFCHRNIVAEVIQKVRPEIWGGADVEGPKDVKTIPVGTRVKINPELRIAISGWEGITIEQNWGNKQESFSLVLLDKLKDGKPVSITHPLHSDKDYYIPAIPRLISNKNLIVLG